MAEVSYTIPGSVNFKRLRQPQGISTTVDTCSAHPNYLLEHLKRFRTVEGFINHKLYHRYASSQNYYYLKDVNHILGEDRSASLITYKDEMTFMMADELMKKFYRVRDYQGKVAKLCEYYKFHKEIPRIFAKEVYDTFFDHHDQKRKVEFLVITKRLREEAGEDVKGELEEGLKKIRDAPYEPMVLGFATVPQGYKKRVDLKETNGKLDNNSHTISNLQHRLSEIFASGDHSISELMMPTLQDESGPEFGKYISMPILGSQILPQTTRITLNNSSKLKINTQTVLKGAAVQSTQNRFAPSMIKAALSPDIVENLKRISLPERTSSKKKPTLVKNKDVEKSVSSKAKSRVMQKAFTREPSQTISARKSSHSLKRGLTLVKRSSDEETKSPPKKEFSDFRITKKGTFELEGSLRKSTDRRDMGYLLGDVEDSQKGLTTWQGSKPVLRRMPSTSSKASFHQEHTDRYPKKTDPDLRSKNTSPNGDMGFSFKVDIERLLKASGIMDYKPSKGGTLTRGPAPIFSGTLGSTSKHKHTRSGPDSLSNFGSLGKPISLQVSAKNSFAKFRQASSTDRGDIITGKRIPLAEHKPYVAESSTFGQQGVKLFKKSGHTKKGSNRF